jgi:hypothetical protein
MDLETSKAEQIDEVVAQQPEGTKKKRNVMV